LNRVGELDHIVDPLASGTIAASVQNLYYKIDDLPFAAA
jgi:hypothetical protein